MGAARDGAALASFRAQMRGCGSGEVTVTDVLTDVRWDSDGNEYTHITLVLNPPTGDTWPLDDVYELQREAYARVGELELGQVSLRVTSSGPAETAEEAGEEPFDLAESLRRSRRDDGLAPGPSGRPSCSISLKPWCHLRPAPVGRGRCGCGGPCRPPTTRCSTSSSSGRPASCAATGR